MGDSKDPCGCDESLRLRKELSILKSELEAERAENTQLKAACGYYEACFEKVFKATDKLMNYALQMTVTVPEKMSAQVVCVREAAETYQEAARSLLDVDGIVELRRNGGEP